MNTIPAIQCVNTFKSNKLNNQHTSYMPITIDNYHKLDSTLLRGAKPTQVQLQELKAHGVDIIISFCTNYNPHNPKAKTLPDEANWAEKLGMKFYWMPFRSKEDPLDSDIKKFFDITDRARAEGKKVFIHCRHGADRTGVFAAMYRLRNQNAKLSDVIRELLRYGHDANHNQNIIPFIINFEKNLNPINKFIKMITNFLKQQKIFLRFFK